MVPFAVGAYITAAYWFTSSTAFANPAVTLARAVSAGTEPGTRVHPEVLEAMREVGIDLSGRTPQKLTDDLARGAQMLITMRSRVLAMVRREGWARE